MQRDHQEDTYCKPKPPITDIGQIIDDSMRKNATIIDMWVCNYVLNIDQYMCDIVCIMCV